MKSMSGGVYCVCVCVCPCECRSAGLLRSSGEGGSKPFLDVMMDVLTLGCHPWISCVGEA